MEQGTDLVNENIKVDESNQSIFHVPSFLVKLFEIVDDGSTQEIVTWTKDGDAFAIK